jgi:hypothetical protein
LEIDVRDEGRLAVIVASPGRRRKLAINFDGEREKIRTKR